MAALCPAPSRAGILVSGGSELTVIYGGAGLAGVGAQRPALGCAVRAGIPAHSRSLQPSRTMVCPLSFARPASVNRALLTAGAALTREEFQKWNNVRLAWAPRALLGAALEGCGLGLPL